MPVIYGTSGADSLIGGGEADTIYGYPLNTPIGDGPDTLDGRDGDDSIIGGEGHDSLLGSAGRDALDGGLGNDTISGGIQEDTISGGDGDDVLYGNTENDSLTGGIGHDTLWGGSEHDTLVGGDGNDSLLGEDGNDNLSGGIGNDTLIGVDGLDTIAGGDGQDSILGGLSADSLAGDGGNDTLIGDVANDTITGGTGDDTISGGDDADNLDGGDGKDTIDGGLDNDSIAGGAGDDSIVGGSGNNTLAGGDDNDWISTGTGVTQITGGAGNDTIAAVGVGVGDFDTYTIDAGIGDDFIGVVGGYSGSIDGGAGADTLYAVGHMENFTVQNVEVLYANDLIYWTPTAFESFNTIQYDQATPARAVVLALSASGTLDLADEVAGRAAIVAGWTGNDSIVGGTGADTLFGSGGDDTLNGGSGNDSLDGGEGNDSFVGPAGQDTIQGGGGDDAVAISGGSSGNFDGGGGNDSVYVTSGGSLSGWTFSNVEMLYTGSNFVSATAAGFLSFGAIRHSAAASPPSISLTLLGGGTLDLSGKLAGQNTAFGVGSGVANVTLSSGNDTLGGGFGADTLNGGDGDDSFVAAAGQDSLIGGGGNDSFTVSGGTVGWIDGGSGSDTVGGSGDLSQVVFSNVETLYTGSSTVIATAAGFEAFTTISHSAASPTATVVLQVVGAGVADLRDELGGRNAFISTVSGGGVAETSEVSTGSGNDTVIGDSRNQRLRSWAGNDSINGGGGNDTLDGFDGNNTLLGGDGNDELSAGSGNDSFAGGDGNDTITPGSGGGFDTISGGAGNDYILLGNIVGAGGQIDGGDDTDIVFAVNLTSWTVSNVEALYTNLNTVTGTAANFSSFQTIAVNGGFAEFPVSLILSGGGTLNLSSQLAGRGAVFTLSSAANVTLGNGGDLLTGSGGNDTLNGGEGSDSVYGGEGNDEITANSGADSLYGQDGSDSFAIGFAGADTGFVDGGDGNDIVHSLGNMAGWTFQNVESLYTYGNKVTATAAGFESFTSIQHSAGFGTFLPVDLVLSGDGTLDLSDELLGRGAIFTISQAANITLSNGTDIMNGSAFGDRLDGGAGGDSIQGGDGADTLIGGAGDDTITDLGNVTATVLSIDAGADNDMISVTGGMSGTIDGGAGNDTLSSNDISKLTLSNIEYLQTNGETVAGTADTFEAFDTIYYSAANPNDVVRLRLTAAGTVDLSSELAGAFAVGFTGSSGDDNITLSSGSDSIFGGDGNDTLTGGNGADTLSGGALFDVATYAGSGGAVAVDLQAGTGTGGHAQGDMLVDIEGLVGSAFADTLSGNNDDNLLDGGAGADSLLGRGGNDTFVVDNVGDTVAEYGNGGTDLVRASVDFTLGTNVENLVLTGAGNLKGTGNAVANSIVGNGGNNLLDGKAGADTLVGGAGNDTYVIDASDSISEGVDAGIDEIQAGFTYTLGANFENLTLTGTGSFNATGNEAANQITGNSGNNSIDGKGGADTLAGGAGNDTYVIDATDSVSEGVNAGIDEVRAGFSYTLGANVENLILLSAGDLAGEGNALANEITGTSGANLLRGWGGADTLTGGDGADTLVDGDLYGGDADSLIGGAGDDSIQSLGGADRLDGGDGFDRAVIDRSTAAIKLSLTIAATSATATLSTGGSVRGVEVFDIVATAFGDNIKLNSGNDTIYGDAGGDLLDGGAGNDCLDGGAGDDTLVVDSAGDIVADSSGIDTIRSSVTWTLGNGFENLVLLNGKIDGTGNALANMITGTTGANTLQGLEGNDTLSAGDSADWLDGGSGADSLIGGTGNDTYVVDNAGDSVKEDAGGGLDTVRTGLNHTLGNYVENLVMTSTGAQNGDGNTLANSITGNDASNTLKGWQGNDTLFGNGGADFLDGGTGADSMRGGDGNDTYVVDDANDVAFEGASTGSDEVQASVSYTILAGIEKLKLTANAAVEGRGSTGDNSIIGNGVANKLYGMAGNDTLDGDAGSDLLDGGVGADSMIGGSGNDTFILDNVGDLVDEAGSTGVDLVQTVLSSYTLTSGVENLTFTGAAASGLGNAGNNVLTGTGANDTLSGLDGRDRLIGGAGNDSLIGGTDLDTFVFATGSGKDRIADFTDASDRLDVAGLGYHNWAEFQAGGGSVTAAGSDTRVIFNGAGDEVLLIGVASAAITAADFTWAT